MVLLYFYLLLPQHLGTLKGEVSTCSPVNVDVPLRVAMTLEYLRNSTGDDCAIAVGTASVFRSSILDEDVDHDIEMFRYWRWIT